MPWCSSGDVPGIVTRCGQEAMVRRGVSTGRTSTAFPWNKQFEGRNCQCLGQLLNVIEGNVESLGALDVLDHRHGQPTDWASACVSIPRNSRQRRMLRAGSWCPAAILGRNQHLRIRIDAAV